MYFGGWILLFGLISVVREVVSHFNMSSFVSCLTNWDSRYPYLAEVRWSQRRGWTRHVHYIRYHQNRHGVLVTNKAVLTRANDLDGYPLIQPREELDLKGDWPPKQPLPKDWKDCIGPHYACLYVNIRRPIDPKNERGQYCGENILVVKVVKHPKFGKTADAQKTFDNGGDGFAAFGRNLKWPFAIAVLAKPVEAAFFLQTFVPTAILPRTPLDFLYLLRRVDTLGPISPLCEYPTYEVPLDHQGLYTPYSEERDARIIFRSRDYRNQEKTLCGLFYSERAGFEGKVPAQNYESEYTVFSKKCNASLLERTLPYTYYLWTGKYSTLNEKYFDTPWLTRKEDSEERLGAPMMCDGVLIGMASSWLHRGTGKRDNYIGTTLMRAYDWLIKQMVNHSVPYKRAADDSPFLGEKYKFKKVVFPTRNYDRNIFELSLSEHIDAFSGYQKIGINFLGIFVFSIILRLFIY